MTTSFRSTLPAVPFFLLACSGSGDPPPVAPPGTAPASVHTHSSASPTGTVAEPALPTPAVIVRDASGRAVPDVEVTFSIATGGGSVTGATQVTNASGVATVGAWTLGTTAGQQRLRATVSGVGSTDFTATATAAEPAILAVVAGTDQIAQVGTALPVKPAVRVRDEYGNAVAGASVTFAVTRGGGTASGTSTTSSAQGVATVGGWIMGSTQGLNGLTATTAGVPGLEILAQAVPASQFHVDLRYLSAATARQKLAFERAAARWRQVIVGDIPDVGATLPSDFCGVGEPQLNTVVDDVLIYVVLGEIDGPGDVLGSAGPCALRNEGNLTAIGVMRFDTDDLAALEGDGRLDGVILHEMGHVFGIGTLWSGFGFVSGEGSPDPYYTGENGRAGFDLIGGATYAGNKVPVENIGGDGTRDSHWRESLLKSELMTGFIGAAGTRIPLSLLTIGAIEDLGYDVTAWGNDRFSYGADLRLGPAAPALELREMPLPRTPARIDASGNVVGRGLRPSLVRQSAGRVRDLEPRPEQRMESRRP